MIIPTGMRYTCRTRGSVLKLVKCESCGGEYVYQLVREATGQGRSVLFLDNEGGQQRARDYAQGKLRALLERECDPVACPDCGTLQQQMVALIRARHWRWLRSLGIFWLVLSAIALLVNLITSENGAPLIPWPIFWPAASIGLVMIILRRFKAKNYDPNNPAELQERKAKGNERAMRKKDFETLVAKQQAAAAQSAATPPPLPVQSMPVQPVQPIVAPQTCPTCGAVMVGAECPSCSAARPVGIA